VTSQDRERFRVDVRRAKHALEQACGRVVHGYRAPNYSLDATTPWAFAVLAEEGYTYDSSVHPIAHDRYGFPDAPRFPYRVAAGGGELWEVPVGTARVGVTNLPLGGGFFRLFPLALVRAAIGSVNRRDGQPVVFYMHPWELDAEQPRPPMSVLHRFRHYVGIPGAPAKLRALLAAFDFTSIDRAFAEVARPALVRANVG
jgi:polysaccharide deacetylase family protein (PEP-CTERM system associated)